jgi:hypothetical protein
MKKQITVNKESITTIFTIYENVSNGEIFKVVRNFQDGMDKDGIEILNLTSIYNWIKEHRDRLKKTAS